MKKIVFAFAFIVFLIGCESEEIPKSNGTSLDYYTESYALHGLGFKSLLKVSYQYDGNKLIRYTVSSFNPDLQTVTEQRHFDFSYANDQVDKIKGYLPGASSHYIEYSYQYLPDSRV